MAVGAGVDAATIERALDTAAATAPGYADLGWVARGRTLARAAQLVRERADELADLAVREVGKAITEARGEVERTAVILDFYAGEATQAKGASIPSAEDGVALLTRRRPIGPTVVITPWNFPLAIPAWKIAPALLCGNPVMWKPASPAIGCAHALARCLLDAGVPGGALSLLLGSGAAVAPLLDGPIEAVSFTGSTAVGHAIRARVAPRGVKVQLELGGKNVAIVLDDADLACAGQIAHAAYAFAGQKCTATSVVLATPGIRGELAERLAVATREAPWGDPARDDVWGAPVIDARKASEIRGTIAGARAEGAEVLAEGPDPGRDAVVPPTLLAARSRELAVAREEIFGPVLAILDAVAAGRPGRGRQRHALRARRLGVRPRRRRDPRAGQPSRGRDGRDQPRVDRARGPGPRGRLEGLGLRRRRAGPGGDPLLHPQPDPVLEEHRTRRPVPVSPAAHASSRRTTGGSHAHRSREGDQARRAAGRAHAGRGRAS